VIIAGIVFHTTFHDPPRHLEGVLRVRQHQSGQVKLSPKLAASRASPTPRTAALAQTRLAANQ
jgi:hypothetical protein